MTTIATVQELGGTRLLGRGVSSALGLARAVQLGLPTQAAFVLKASLRLADPELSALLGTSSKTLSRLRRARRSRLSAVASDRLTRVAALFAFAKEVLGDAEAARAWLKTPQLGLNNEMPLTVIRTAIGAREVEDLLGRLEHGVFS